LVSADKISLSLGATAPETSIGVSADKRDFETQEMNSPNDKKAPKIRRRFYFERAQGVVLAATFVISTGFIFYLGLLTGQNIQKRAKAVIEKPLARIPVVAPLAEPAAIDPGPQSISAIAPAKEAVKSKTALVAAKVDVPNASPASSLPSLSAHTGTGDANVGPRYAAATTSKNQPVAPASSAVFEGKPWSVQIAASVEKNVADMMAQRLTAKGYEGFVVEAEVNGKTWYRVRVGRLAVREEAEKLRQVLDAKEGLHGTYVARD
jgi:cell division septation protein DedD